MQNDEEERRKASQNDEEERRRLVDDQLAEFVTMPPAARPGVSETARPATQYPRLEPRGPLSPQEEGLQEEAAQQAFRAGVAPAIDPIVRARGRDYPDIFKDVDRPRGALFGGLIEGNIAGVSKGFREPSRYRGAQLPGVRKLPTVPREALGLGAEIALDPTNLLPVVGFGPDIARGARVATGVARRGVTVGAERTAPTVRRLATEEAGALKLPRRGKVTPDAIHALADSKGIAWDNDPAFLARTKALTGKEHLDDLTAPQLRKVYDNVATEAAPTTTAKAGGAGGPPTIPPRKPPVGPEGGGDVPPTDPVKKLAALIKAAKPARKETEALKHAEVSRRVGRASGMLEAAPGSSKEAFRVARSQLAGALPVAKFEAPESLLTPGDVESLYSAIRFSDKQFFFKSNTETALTKVLTGQIPQRAEIAKLEEMFGPELASALLSKRGLGPKALEVALDIANIPRAVLSSVDFSGILRQAVFAAPSHPKEWGGNVPVYLRAFASDSYAQAVDQSIRTGKYAALKEQAGLFMSPLDSVSAELTRYEEAFMSKLINKIPLIKQSQRGYIVYLNKLRSDIFDTIIKNWEGTAKIDDPAELRALGHHINIITGRGELGRLSGIAPVLNATFFSPRLITARIETPVEVFFTTPGMRKLVARDLAAFVGTGMSVLGLMKLAGADIEIDPRSSDFGKGRFGPVRVDFWGGFQQLARYSAQLATGEFKSTSTGEIGESDRWDVFGRFLRSKLAPVPSSVINIISGKNVIGEGITIEDEAIRLGVPIFINDLIEAYSEGGLKGALVASPSGLGVNVASYGGKDLPIREAGLFRNQIDDASWKAVQQQAPEQFAVIKEYGSYERWRAALKEAYMEQAKDEGIDEWRRTTEVEIAVTRHPIVKAMNKARETVRDARMRASPEAAKRAIEIGALSAGRAERAELAGSR